MRPAAAAHARARGGVVRPGRRTPRRSTGRASRRAERLIAFWFALSVVGTLGFIVTNFVGDKHAAYYTPGHGRCARAWRSAGWASA